MDAARPPAREATGEDVEEVGERKGGGRRRLRLMVTALVKARPRGTSGCDHRLVVRDLRAGTERSWPLDPALRLGQIAWSPDGDLLAYELNGEATGARHQLRVVRVASMRAVDDGLALRAPDNGCRLGLPASGRAPAGWWSPSTATATAAASAGRCWSTTRPGARWSGP